ncbi:MAG: FAD-dependent oxidoreductase, partial [Kiritimatiellota bacterium]|nr:FAD-dependent oxidoreductase [Kiritimatiellota bacterium]
RFVADLVRQKRAEGLIPPEPKPVIDPAKPKIAIVGSGPSGLTCAADLAKRGYPVTIFEASARPGGQLQSAIPKYRLPKEALAAEIQDIVDMGIELKLNSPVGERLSLADLRAQGYQAIYLAVGAQKSRSLPIPGIDLSGVKLSLDFLREAEQSSDITIGKRVVVVGGGNGAMDVARTARRLGATEVNVVCLESHPEMPAHAWEIEEAEEEGIKINPSWGPKQIIAAAGGKVAAVEFKKCTAVFDSKKTFNPTYDESNVARFDCDTVIIAIGQAADASFLPKETKIQSSRGGFIIVDPVTLATGEPGIFAGGDGVTGPKSAVEAIYHGHEAAISIDRYLNGHDLSENRQQPKETPAPTPEGIHEKKARVHLNRIPLERRLASFDEIELGYTEDEARAETKRCLNCGLCSECLQCVAVCKANAVNHAEKPEVRDIEVGSIILATGFEP